MSIRVNWEFLDCQDTLEDKDQRYVCVFRTKMGVLPVKTSRLSDGDSADEICLDFVEKMSR